MLQRPGPSGFGYNSTAEEVSAGRDLQGQTWLVTGCNSGLGQETARVLALRGARVVGAARTQAKAREAAVGNDFFPLACELSEPASVIAAVDTVQKAGLTLDGIVANAGIMALPNREVRFGVEMQLLTNHFGHARLVLGLLDRLHERGRVVMLSSMAHTRAYAEGVRLDDLGAERGYTAWGAYGQAKLANLLFAKALAKRLPKAGQSAYAVHPGVIATNLSRHMGLAANVFALTSPLFLKSVPQGAATQTYCAVHPDAAGKSGLYWADCNVATPSAHGQDDALAEALWKRTEEMLPTLGV